MYWEYRFTELEYIVAQQLYLETILTDAPGNGDSALVRASPSGLVDNYAHVVGATLPIEQG